MSIYFSITIFIINLENCDAVNLKKKIKKSIFLAPTNL